MNNNPVVSIQIPTYNQKVFIKEAIDSALAQTYENLQIIVSDDCSLDYDIFEYLKDYINNPKVLIHRNLENVGRVRNYRNTLFNLVEGEWFVNLDGDDYFIQPEFISTAIDSIKRTKLPVSVFQANSNINNILECGVEYVKLNDETITLKGNDFIQNLDKSVGFTHASTLYNTFEAQKSNFYNIDALDIDYFSYLKILKHNYVILCTQKVSHWRVHDLQATWTLDFNLIMTKYEEIDDLKEHYSDVDHKYKVKMFEGAYNSITTQLIDASFSEKFSFLNFKILLIKINCNPILIKCLVKAFRRSLLALKL